MASPAEFLWRLLPEVRPRERRRFFFFASLWTLITLAQTLGLAGSEALFLAEFGAESLPVTFIAASLLTVFGSMLYAARVGNARNDELFIQMLVGCGALLVGCGALLVASTAGIVTGGPWILAGLFCFFFLTQAVFVNHLWTFTGDYFDTVSAKRLATYFTVGASLGGFVGGVLAWLVTVTLGPLFLIAGWGVLLVAAAVLLRVGRRRLRRWGPLELEEADETSVQSMRGAMMYLRRSSLGRWLVVSAASMMLALFVAQYLYSDVFARAFPTSSELASFFAIYLAVTNLVEIAIELKLTPWLIHRFGVPTANLLHPVLTLISFGGLALQYGIAAGIGARVNRELLDNSLSQPVRNLVYNAMPVRFRGRMRAFLEGMVVYAGMTVAGCILLLIGDPDPSLLAAAGAATAVVYFFANTRVRRAYLRAIVDELKKGRLDLAEVEDEIGNWEASRLAELWNQLVRGEGSAPSRSLLQLITAMVSHGIIEPVLRETSHPSAAVRRSCVNGLRNVDAPEVETCLVRALGDPDAGVRLAALRALARVADWGGTLAPRLRRLVADPDPEVRAEAAAHSGEEGTLILKQMIGSEDAAEVVAGLGAATGELLDIAITRVRDPDPGIRAASLDCIGRLALECPISMDELLRAVRDSDSRVRRAAAQLLSNLEDPAALSALANALGDPAPDVQFVVERSLGELGDEGIEIVRPHLRSDRERAVDAAVRVLSKIHSPRTRQILSDEVRYRARELWYDVIAFQRLPRDDSPAGRFLAAAFQDDMIRQQRLSFSILGGLVDRGIIRKVEKALRLGGARSKGDALEVLSNLGDREAAHLLVLMFEEGPFDERVRAVSDLVEVPRDSFELVSASRRSQSPWIRMAAEELGRHQDQTSKQEDLMERLLALKQVPLFAHLSLEQLEAIQSVTDEVEFLPNEMIIRQGDAGSELYLLIEGKVNVYLDHGLETEQRLKPMSAVCYFGEMATLSDEPRTATIIAARPSRLLCLDGQSLKELIHQMPDISFEIFRVLTSRVREAEKRIRE